MFFTQKTSKIKLSALSAASVACLASQALAQSTDASTPSTPAGAANTAVGAAIAPNGSDAPVEPVQEVVINGSQFRGKVTPMAMSTDPKSDIGSVTALSADDIQRQSLASEVDIFRSIPGVQVSDFGQVGLAQGITVRGWPGANDSSAVAFYLDGVQRNEASGTGANGYLDIHPLIPEVLNGLTVVKGPFDTRYGGDFALAASAIATTADYLPSSLTVSGGSYGQGLILGVYGYKDGELSFYTAVEGEHDDGFQQNSRDNKIDTFTKLSFPLGPGRLALSLQTYDIKYGSPGYIDLQNLNNEIISSTSDVNGTDGGSKDEQTFVAHYVQGTQAFGLDATGYVDAETRHRFDTFTPYPSEGTEDKRTFYGVSLEPHASFNLFQVVDTEVLAGVSARHDDINILELPAVDGHKVYTPTFYDAYYYEKGDIGQTQLSGYANVELKPTYWLKLTGGFRYDWFDYDVDNTTFNDGTGLPASVHVTANTGTFSPKGGIAIQPIKEITVFANYGSSLVSPDAWRDIAISPSVTSSILTSKEVGVAFNVLSNRLHLQLSTYDTTFSNEVTFQGLTAVNDGRTKRTGYDIETSAVALRNDWITARLYANYSKVSAHLADGSFVPNVAKWVAAYGLHSDILPRRGSTDRFTFDAGQEWIGPQELDDSPNTAESGSYNRVSAKFAYQIPDLHDLTLSASGIFYPDSRTDEFGFVLANRVYVTSLPESRLMFSASTKF